MKTSNDTIKIVGFLLLAGIVGAGVGVLFAPHKGSKTRKRLAEGAKDIAEDFQNKIKDETNAVCKKAEELKGQTMSAIEEIIKDVEHEAMELIHD